MKRPVVSIRILYSHRTHHPQGDRAGRRIAITDDFDGRFSGVKPESLRCRPGLTYASGWRSLR
jgi:hypothetical protein